MVVALWPQNISEPDALLLKRSKWLCVGITNEMRFTLWQPVAWWQHGAILAQLETRVSISKTSCIGRQLLPADDSLKAWQIWRPWKWTYATGETDTDLCGSSGIHVQGLWQQLGSELLVNVAQGCCTSLWKFLQFLQQIAARFTDSNNSKTPRISHQMSSVISSTSAGATTPWYFWWLPDWKCLQRAA